METIRVSAGLSSFRPAQARLLRALLRVKGTWANGAEASTEEPEEQEEQEGKAAFADEEGDGAFEDVCLCSPRSAGKTMCVWLLVHGARLLAARGQDTGGVGLLVLTQEEQDGEEGDMVRALAAMGQQHGSERMALLRHVVVRHLGNGGSNDAEAEVADDEGHDGGQQDGIGNSPAYRAMVNRLFAGQMGLVVCSLEHVLAPEQQTGLRALLQRLDHMRGIRFLAVRDTLRAGTGGGGEHGVRPDLAAVGELRDAVCPQAPCVLLSEAITSFDELHRRRSELHMGDAVLQLKSSFAMGNVYFAVRFKQLIPDPVRDLANLLHDRGVLRRQHEVESAPKASHNSNTKGKRKRKRDAWAIVFVHGNAETERLASSLVHRSKADAATVVAVHSDCTPAERAQRLRQWCTGTAKVLCTTSATFLATVSSVDLPAHCDLVVHWNLPKSLLAFVTHIHVILNAYAVQRPWQLVSVLYESDADVLLYKYTLQRALNKHHGEFGGVVRPGVLEAVRKAARDVDQVAQYCRSTASCRRVSLMQSIGEFCTRAVCAQTCDVCAVPTKVSAKAKQLDGFASRSEQAKVREQLERWIRLCPTPLELDGPSDPVAGQVEVDHQHPRQQEDPVQIEPWHCKVVDDAFAEEHPQGLQLDEVTEMADAADLFGEVADVDGDIASYDEELDAVATTAVAAAAVAAAAAAAVVVDDSVHTTAPTTSASATASTSSANKKRRQISPPLSCELKAKLRRMSKRHRRLWCELFWDQHAANSGTPMPQIPADNPDVVPPASSASSSPGTTTKTQMPDGFRFAALDEQRSVSQQVSLTVSRRRRVVQQAAQALRKRHSSWTFEKAYSHAQKVELDSLKAAHNLEMYRVLVRGKVRSISAREISGSRTSSSETSGA